MQHPHISRYQFHTLTNKMHYVKYNKTQIIKHFIFIMNSYMFWHQDTILQEFNDDIGS